MKEDGYILNKLKKAALPKVPEKFFRDFSAELWQLIELEDDSEGLLDELVVNRFEIDFNSVNSIDVKDLEGTSSKMVLMSVKKPKMNKILLWAGAVAACLAIFFTWPDTTNTSQLIVSDESTEEIILAYLDEGDLMDYLVDAIEIDDITVIEEEILYETLEDEIYNYINDI